ncbi:MAG TPA: UDP-N-acetylglucosamine 2-epimerase (non-hydrolyzing) [Candidatus Eisenbacteria bacterium]|nr:UDP-N-acetylglucosamine 2-epimerase (non-hydrolyzing) [Candidatus Eisenbacteria bacterium]
MRVLAVVGARPNFVKIAPIMAELAEYPYISTTLVHTGQHYDSQMSDSFFANLEIPRPDVNLKVQSPSAIVQIAEIMSRLEGVIESTRPDVVVVVGDVNSTVAATLAAAKMDRPVAHVEAGLRSFDRSMPEEVNRVLTDSVSSLLFTTETSADENLAREGISADRVHFVGNVMIDTLFRYRERARQSDVLERLRFSPAGYAVLTLHRPSNVDDEGTLGMLLSAVGRIQGEIPVVFPVHPRTRRRLEALGAVLPPMLGLRLVDPMPYLDFLQLMAEARCVLTDSGGIQEETTALRIPCLTLRHNTERPVTVVRGTNRIVGTDPRAIYEAWRVVAEGRWPEGELPELWDGKAASRIVRVLVGTAR